MDLNEEELMKKVSSVLKNWGTCPANLKGEVLSQFLKHVERKLHKHDYPNKAYVEQDLMISKSLLSKFHAQYREYEKKHAKAQLQYHRDLQSLTEIELFIWDIYKSAEDIPKRYKKWMEMKLDGKDKETIADLGFGSERVELRLINSLEKMGSKVPVKTELKREKMVQSKRSKAFMEENYMLIDNKKEKNMLIQIKMEEYTMLEQSIAGLLIEMGTLCEPFNLCAEFHFQEYKRKMEVLTKCLEEKLRKFGGKA